MISLLYSDKRFSALGFGARIPPNYEVDLLNLFFLPAPFSLSVFLSFFLWQCFHMLSSIYACSYLAMVFACAMGLSIEQSDRRDLFSDPIRHTVKIPYFKLIIEVIFIHKPLFWKYQPVWEKIMFSRHQNNDAST